MKITSNQKITDAHMHLPVDFETLSERRDALLSEMHENGVCRGVVISDSEFESRIGSLADCAELFRETPDIAVIGGISPYIQYEKQLTVLENYIADGTVAGIKLFCGHEPIYLNDPVLAPVFALAEKYTVLVLFHSGWENAQYTAPEIILETAERHPQVAFVCCHCCYPHLAACFAALSARSDVYFDISSIADSEPAAFQTILEQEITQNPERFIFGSDFGSCSQKAHLAFARTLQLSAQDRALLMHGNADRLYFR